MKGGTERVTQRGQQEQRPPEERECGVDRKARAAGATSDPRERGTWWGGQLGGSGEALGVLRRSHQLFQEEDNASVSTVKSRLWRLRGGCWGVGGEMEAGGPPVSQLRGLLLPRRGERRAHSDALLQQICTDDVSFIGSFPIDGRGFDRSLWGQNTVSKMNTNWHL